MDLLEHLASSFPPLDVSNELNFQFDGIAIKIVAEDEGLLSRLTRALEHAFMSAASEIALTLEIRTSPEPWLKTDSEALRRFQGDRQNFFYNPGIEDGFAHFSFIDHEQKRAIFWVADPTSIPWYEFAAPFKTIFHWFFPLHGYQLIHAATVGDGDRGLLLVGKGGKGKSSTALSIFTAARLKYVSDDYALLKLDPSPVALSLYSSAKISPDSLSRLPFLNQVSPADRIESQEKYVFFLGSYAKKQLAHALPINALVVPEISLGSGKRKKLSAAEALLALAPSTIFQLLPQDTHRHAFIYFTKLVKAVPAYTLQVGGNVKEVEAALHKLIKTI